MKILSHPSTYYSLSQLLAATQLQKEISSKYKHCETQQIQPLELKQYFVSFLPSTLQKQRVSELHDATHFVITRLPTVLRLCTKQSPTFYAPYLG